AVVFNRLNGDGSPGSPQVVVLRKGLKLTLHSSADGSRQIFTDRDEQGVSILIVLGLRKQIRSHHFRICRLVGEYQDFTGSGDTVDIHLSKNKPLGCCHKDVPRTNNLVHSGDRLGSVSPGRDGLGASCVHKGGDASKVASCTYFGIGVGAGDVDLVHACDLGRDRAHQDGGRITGLSTWRVDPGPTHGHDATAK